MKKKFDGKFVLSNEAVERKNRDGAFDELCEYPNERNLTKPFLKQSTIIIEEKNRREKHVWFVRSSLTRVSVRVFPRSIVGIIKDTIG